MDLMDLKPKSDVVEVFLKHPISQEPVCNDDGSEMTITIYAQHSTQYRAAIHEQQDKRIKAMQKKGNTSTYTAAELEQDQINLLAKIVKEWDITYGKEKVKLTQGKAKEIFTEVFWLRGQVEEALSESVDFTKG